MNPEDFIDRRVYERFNVSTRMACEQRSIGNPESMASRDLAWLAGVVLIGLTARLLHLGHQPFWLDEALTYQRIHLGLESLVTDSFSNRHMPSYFLMLQAFSHLNPNDAWLRMPSALFGTASIGIVFIIARRVANRSAAIIAGLLMALSPLQVQYGQEARSYTLVTLLISVALWGLVRLAQHPGHAALSMRHRDFERTGWAAYLVGTICALDVLGDAAPWLVAANLSLYLIWRSLPLQGSSALRNRFRSYWMLSALLIAVCCAPFYGAILAFSDGQMLHKFDWIPPLSWHNLEVTAKSVYLMRSSTVVRFGVLPTAVPLLGLLIVAPGLLGGYRLRNRLEGRVLVLGFAVLPLFVLAASLVQSMVLPRYILWSAAPFFVLVGVGAAALPRRAAPLAVSMLLVLSAVNLLPMYRTETKPRWDRAAAALASNVRPGDTIFTADPNAPTMLEVLQPRVGTPIGDTALITSNLDVALQRWRRGGRVWAVNGRSALGLGETLDTFKARMVALGIPTLELSEGKEITILLFAAPSFDENFRPTANAEALIAPSKAAAVESRPVSRRRIAP